MHKTPRLASRALLWLMTTSQLHEAVTMLGPRTAHQWVRDLLLGEYERRQGVDAAALLRKAARKTG